MNCIDEMNSESVILSFAHQPATFFTQFGISLELCSNIFGFSVGVYGYLAIDFCKISL